MISSSKMDCSLFDEANQEWDAGNKKRAFNLFLAAAKSGEEDAYNSVGYFYDQGIGIKKNPEGAYMWYRRAAMRGNLAGCLNLGVWYRDAGNLRRSKFWFSKAYAQGDGSAAYELGKIYLKQRSRASLKLAQQYLTIAATSKFITDEEKNDAKVQLSKISNT